MDVHADERGWVEAMTGPYMERMMVSQCLYGDV